jgi:hypothetical protein
LIFSEKINYRKLHPLGIYSVLADKCSVRKYVSKRIGEKCLMHSKCLLFNYNDVFVLKGKCVAKTIHGSGTEYLKISTSKNYSRVKKNFNHL